MSTVKSEEFESRSGTGITIRLATASDALTLARLRYRFRSNIDLACENEAEFVERCKVWMQEGLRDGNPWRCWVAERDGTLLGNLWIRMIEKVPNPTDEPENHAYLTNFYVTENARGNGIGSMLLSTALAWCRNGDVQAIILWPTEESRPLYLRHGFSVRDDLLELMISQDDENSPET